ncbi:MAG: helix-turn-helix domain-containing protein [Syntrophobacteraceae bacterium]
MPNDSFPEYLTLKELSSYSGLSISTLRNWKRSGMPYFKLGRSIRVKRSDFDIWAEKFRVSSSADRKIRVQSAWDMVFSGA